MSFHHILVPTDFSDCAGHALEQAMRLPRASGAIITLFHAYQLPSVYPATDGLTEELTDTTEDLALSELHRLEHRARRLAAQSGDGEVPAIRLKLANDLPVRAILAEAQAGEYDLIVLGTHGHGGLRRALLGSVAEPVVRAAPCPVLTVREGIPAEKGKAA